MNSFADYLLIILELICAAGIIRNNWVFKNRMKHLETFGVYYYNKLPSYSKMMLHFWVWDFTKFFKY